jgi:hypothetical protein
MLRSTYSHSCYICVWIIFANFTLYRDIIRPPNLAMGHAVAQLVEALLCMSKSGGFDRWWGSYEFFIDLTLSAALWPWGVDSAEMSTRGISWGEMPRTDILTIFMCRLSWNLGASASNCSQGLSRPVQGFLYFYRFIIHYDILFLAFCLQKLSTLGFTSRQ